MHDKEEGKKMLDWMKEKFRGAVDAVLADRAIFVSQDSINSSLAEMTKDIPELTSISMQVHDGFFDLHASGRKFLPFRSRTRFEISSWEITKEKQIIDFRRTAPTEISVDGFFPRIFLALFCIPLCRVFRIEPANFVLKDRPGITIQDDLYSLDLSQTDLSGQITPKIARILDVVGALLRVKELRCIPDKLEVLVGI